ncbi:hypothetical protein SEEC0006_15759 [Salmonella enterica subsp. enterica serovar Choleraesuis str. 0006]|nr:hypothetical protein SEEC0006_15759 [Salmonella enterica subsp. enterica serovar Choleraesuis str. 0006]
MRRDSFILRPGEEKTASPAECADHGNRRTGRIP